MSRSSRQSQHIQPVAPASASLKGTIPESVPSSTAAPTEAAPQGGLYGKLLWVSMLLWLTVFLGLTLTVWLDLIIGVINWQFFKKT